MQELVKVGKGSIGSKLMLLGLTFKENCSDLRNSRVPDIFAELRAYGCEVYVHDPYCNAVEAQEDYDIKITSLSDVPVVDAIVLAVLHRPFREWTLAQWLRLLSENALMVDVKGGAPRSGLENAGVRIWRL